MFLRLSLASFILLSPAALQAAVTINEVAWMGSGDSANHEWIELYNDTANTVILDGWTLSDSANLSIELTGAIAGNSYAVLERTSDASAPGSAFFIYTGALANTGTTLSLRRADGGLEDQVAGGNDWSNIGGDNTTKETAQYTTSGWITATPTPGAHNETTGTDTSQNDEEEEEQSSTKTSTNNTAKTKNSTSPSRVLTLPPNTLELSVVAPVETFVRQNTAFTVEPSGVGETIQNSVTYYWNFGDGNTTTGKEVSHRYEFPGTYLVTVYGSYKRQEYMAKVEITVLPVALSITRNQNGDVQLNNDAPYEIDISGYRLMGNKGFIFAPNSFVLPRQSITLAGKNIGGTVSVYDRHGKLVARENAVASNHTESIIQPVVAAVSTAVAPTPTASAEITDQETEEPVVASTTLIEPEVIQIGDSRSSAGNESSPTNDRWPYLALAGIILFGWFTLIYRQ